jgi:hypothetical protein
VDQSYTTLWTQQACRALRQYGQEGTRLALLFGGPHTSEPSFRRAGVSAGDFVYPVRVLKGTVYVLARLRVQRILSVAEWIAADPDRFADCEPRDPLAGLFTDEFITSEWVMGTLQTTLENWCRVYPELRERLPSPTDPAAVERYVRAAYEQRRQRLADHGIPSPTFDQSAAHTNEVRATWAPLRSPRNDWTEERIKGLRTSEIFAGFFQHHPELGYLAPTCTTEVVIGEEGTPIRLDVAVPPDLLERLRFRSRRGERGLKHIQNGRLTQAITLQGIYRLSPSSADELAALLEWRLTKQ